ncbi:MAG: hypothetical protein SGILL_004595 [Bacillariaceae sp.]
MNKRTPATHPHVLTTPFPFYFSFHFWSFSSSFSGDNSNPSCKQVADFGLEEVASADEVCNIIQAHKDFCGCPEALPTPLNNCYLCPDGSPPTNLASETPFEDTCSELDTYLRYLPADLCATERAESMKRSDVFCGCAGAQADCYMCDGDNNNLSQPDRLVPFFEFLGNSFSTTCKDLADFYTLYDTEDPEISTCDFVKMESRYCGCASEPSLEPVNACNLCTDGASPVDGTKLIDELGMTCNQLQNYLAHVPADQCAMPWIVDLQRFDYYCGCVSATAECPICPDGTIDVANPDAIVPYLIIPDNENPTCSQLATLGVIAEPGELVLEDCSIFTSQAAYCGCPTAIKPDVGCEFCPGGSAPPNPDLVTPFGDTCSELSDYLTYLTPDQCSSDRVGFMQRQDFLCGCASATTQCALCGAHGSNDVSFPDRHIPLLSLPLNSNPTCQEVVEFMAVNDGDLSEAGCSALQGYQGYCGCPSVVPGNQCSFCPNGGSPSTPNKVVSELFTCGALEDFASYLTTENCQADNTDFQQIQAFAYTCGCPNTQPDCTLCPNGAAPSSPNTLMADGETRCSEFADLVETLTADQCTQQSSTLDAARAECGCPGGSGNSGTASGGQCAVQQNANLCTTDLLASVNEQCACYAFCDGAFVKCQAQEGGLLAATECLGTPVTGCNSALALSNGNGGGSSSGSSAAKDQPSDGDDGDNNALTIALAVTIPCVILLLVIIYYFFTRKGKQEPSKMSSMDDGNEGSLPPVTRAEASLSMADVPMPPPSSPSSGSSLPSPPPDSSFSSFDSSPIASDDNKMV